MLKYTINKSNIKSDSIPLFNWKTEDYSLFLDKNGIGIEFSSLKNGEKLRLIRQKCEKIAFSEDKEVFRKNDKYYIPLFEDIKLNYKNADKVYLKTTLEEGEETPFWKITFSNKHVFINPEIDDCNIVVKDDIYPPKLDGEKKYLDFYEGKKCKGDFIRYNGYFLYRAEGIDEDGEYIFGNEDFLNCKKATIILQGDWILEENLLSGENWYVDEEQAKLYLLNCIVPYDMNGLNDCNTILWQGDFSFQAFKNNINNTKFYCKDERFIKCVESGITLNEGTFVYQIHDYIDVTSLMSDNINANLLKEYNIKNALIPSILEENKIDITDFEKQIFYPVYGEENKEINSLSFNLHFRQRIFDENEKWITKDELLWNNYPYYDEEENTLVPKDSFEGDASDADLLGDIGFTDDDVYYQKNCLSKSFLRILIYDNCDRRSQTLLAYSTIFINSGMLYGKYINKLKLEGSEADERGLVYSEGNIRLSSSFICKNKYYYDNSSEGFYLYLFPNLLERLPETIGKEGRVIYMKVEFNHAKFGQTIPFTIPISEENKPINPLDSNFPINYREEEEGTTFINMSKLYGDMYIPVQIGYDSDKRQYFWKFLLEDIIDEEGNVSLNFFEPKINFSENLTKIAPIQIGEYSVEMSGDASTIEIEVSSDLPWVCDIEDEGLNIGEFIKKEGIDGEYMKFSLSKNASGQEREFRFIFSNGQKTIKTDLIKQKAIETPSLFKALILSPLGRYIASEGGEIQISTTSNEEVRFSVYINDKEQIIPTEERIKSPGTNIFTYSVGQNLNFNEYRVIHVNIFEHKADGSHGEEVSYDFVQHKAPEIISVNPKALRFPKEGGEQTLVITYSGSYDNLRYSIVGDIKDVARIYDSGGQNVTVKLPELSTEYSRSGQFIIKGITKTITVNITQHEIKPYIR